MQKTKQNLRYRRTVDLTDIVIPGNDVVKMCHIIKKSHEGENLPYISDEKHFLTSAVKEKIATYEKEHGKIQISSSGLTAKDAEDDLESAPITD